MLKSGTLIIGLFVLSNIFYFVSLFIRNRKMYLFSMSLYFIVAAAQCWKFIHACQHLQAAGVVLLFVVSLFVGTWLAAAKPEVKSGGGEDGKRA